ncbi:major facilitator superfamily transporter [Colletotrichum scovillei]|uniref:Major facilitator superfamily transporter n=1 Tax=Colletotrichum scovillei TaxID=1209932 RepID=A0A9P7R0C1_9PEZI|nr:major facilitator superfamily transporter [Colletotrichum scovillei]KAF4779117.1 major facilitator superfamily transporter [Colletotrichum scovillei]KAG7047166.1 major facilitator superfamily transporter [Colletotrichum scovillei]KAG7057002.1 major facilitator superfamily transporter [Colletotrichum scovillei]KAG7066934.1 major facilitator superfamily transporter [Colletotrichum scovillei]
MPRTTNSNNIARAAAVSRTASSGSFHAGAPIPTLGNIESSRRTTMRRQSTHRYHTFPTPPPKTPREQSSAELFPHSDEDSDASDDDHRQTPLPVKQLALLAFLSLSEQTALNSIGPYLPQMVESFADIPDSQTGLYVGILASAFALAQLSTNLLWGYLSDVVGRKPTMVLGTFMLACCFVGFGFCRTYWQIVVVHVAMGMLNGNAAVVPTVLGEVTDRSNQSRAFTWLPVIYSLGGITGPALGGLLVGTMGKRYPYLAPNLLSAGLLFISVIVVAIWFEETLETLEPDHAAWIPAWARKAWSWISREAQPRRGSWATRWPRRGSQAVVSTDDDEEEEEGDDEDDAGEDQGLLQHASENDAQADDDAKLPGDLATWRQLLNRNTVLVLLTYLVFQLSNISYNSLYPIFADANPPTGRGLPPSKIGISLSLAGVATIVFQAFLFQHLKTRLGNLGTYRIALLGLAVSMALMPWIPYLDDEPLFGIGSGSAWLYAELGVILIIKNICAVGGLSSVMLLITNCAPNHATLGTLNGIAQTLSAAGRSFGPFVSGSLFTLSTRVHPKGEALVWGIFGGIALLGWIGSLAIRNRGLESDDWVGEEDGTDGETEP